MKCVVGGGGGGGPLQLNHRIFSSRKGYNLPKATKKVRNREDDANSISVANTISTVSLPVCSVCGSVNSFQSSTDKKKKTKTNNKIK